MTYYEKNNGEYNPILIDYLSELRLGNTISQIATISNMGFMGTVTESDLAEGIKPKQVIETLIKYYEMFVDIQAITVSYLYNSKMTRIVCKMNLDLSKLPVKKNEYGVYEKIPITKNLIETNKEIRNIYEITKYYGFELYNLTPNDTTYTGQYSTGFENTNVPLAKVNSSITMRKYNPLDINRLGSVLEGMKKSFGIPSKPDDSYYRKW